MAKLTDKQKKWVDEYLKTNPIEGEIVGWKIGKPETIHPSYRSTLTDFEYQKRTALGLKAVASMRKAAEMKGWFHKTWNPYLNEILPYDIEQIDHLLTFIHKPYIPQVAFAAYCVLLDYYFPQWKDHVDPKIVGLVIDRSDPIVAKWRNKVIERDGNACTECGSIKNLCAHHIYHWSEFPSLRLELSNGITLCDKCHSKKHPEVAKGMFVKKVKQRK